jgi:hypothetical protein
MEAHTPGKEGEFVKRIGQRYRYEEDPDDEACGLEGKRPEPGPWADRLRYSSPCFTRRPISLRFSAACLRV